MCCARTRQPALPDPPGVQMICVTDLESDYINPFDFTTRMNTWVVRP
jgi:hypothetical protein